MRSLTHDVLEGHLPSDAASKAALNRLHTAINKVLQDEAPSTDDMPGEADDTRLQDLEATATLHAEGAIGADESDAVLNELLEDEESL